MSKLLDILLADDPKGNDRPTEPFKWERKGVEIPCQGLFVDEIRALRKKATRVAFNPKTHEREDQFDLNEYHDLLIIACTPDAPWTDQRVREHYGVAEATAALRKALRHVEDYGSLLEHYMKLSGIISGETRRPDEQVQN